MSGNIFGNLFRLSTFGESHGLGLGGIIDGCPAGLKLDFNKINYDLSRRRPGQSSIVTQRKENDEVVFFSGILNSITTGTPIGFFIKNKDHKSQDYENIKNLYRPSHSDYTYHKKYGIRDHKGGGRSSARETVCRIVGGSIAKQLLNNVNIIAYVSAIGNISLKEDHYNAINFANIENTPVRCPEIDTAKKMINLIKTIKSEGDTIGGTISCVIKNPPTGLGEPVFNKLHAELGKAMLSINAVKGFEYGSGFSGTKIKGSEHNDIFFTNGKTKTNFSGGIQGGISNGMDIYFKVAFKPVATIMKQQSTINIQGDKIDFMSRGRHDPCVVPRAVPIVESMAALVMVDYWLYNKLSKI